MLQAVVELNVVVEHLKEDFIVDFLRGVLAEVILDLLD